MSIVLILDYGNKNIKEVEECKGGEKQYEEIWK